MILEPKDNWLGHKLGSVQDEQLFTLMEEISDFQRTGVLVGGDLRALEREFSDNVSKTPYGECMRLVEDAVLYEMARRYHNYSLETARWVEYTGEDAGFHFCSKCKCGAFNYQDGDDVIEVLSDFCPHCGRPMEKSMA